MLIRFGNFAVDWSKVYAVRRDVRCADSVVSYVYADVPGAAVDRPVLEVADKEIGRAVWNKAKDDPRFTKFEKGALLAVDLSHVVAVQPIAGRDVLTFDLKNVGGGFSLEPGTAQGEEVLNAIPADVE